MKVLFVENRYKTYFWDKLAEGLVAAGVDVHWIVQNHAFIPKNGKVHVIPYPRVEDLRPVSRESLSTIASKDRSINYFDGNSRHYEFYQGKIESILEDICPDWILGESTLFHELITIDAARSRNTPYLHPSSCRIPPGRFSFYLYDTLEIHGGSNQVVTEEEAEQFLQQWANRTVKIDYMKKNSRMQAYVAIYKKIASWLVVLRARLAGETYNTPSFLTKWGLMSRQKKAVARWEDLAVARQPKANVQYVMYPMHMQPECNIDVWGYRYREQDLLIGDIASNLPAGWGLLVKPNPKSKYELSTRLMDIIEADGRIVPLSHTSVMADVLKMASTVVTVSGTIALESVLSNYPCLSLAMPYMRDQDDGIRHLLTLPDLPNKLPEIIAKRSDMEGRKDAIRLYKYQVQSSYRGLISDPVSDPRCVSEENIGNVMAAMLDIMKWE